MKNLDFVLAQEKERVLQDLIEVCQENLYSDNGKHVLDYLVNERGLSEKVISFYKIGYFPRNINTLIKYFPKEILEDLKIVSNYYADIYRSYFSESHYMIIPIKSEFNEILAISGRTLYDSAERSFLGIPKYLNSSYNKKDNLFGLNFTRHNILKKDNVYVVEGYFDQIALHSRGINNSVAVCGTSFTKEQFLLLAKYTSNISFLLDNDEGGWKSMNRIKNQFSGYGINLTFYSLPDKFKDVDEFFSTGKSKKDFVKELTSLSLSW